MSWNTQDSATAGKFLMGEVQAGWNFDVIGSVTEVQLLDRLRLTAQGWTPSQVEWTRGVFGIGESLRIFGRATAPISTESVRMQMATAVDSFWLMAGSDVRVFVSDDLIIPDKPVATSEWAQTLKLISAAVIVVGIIWGIKQIKEIAK